MVNYLPTKPVNSDIINYDQLAYLWMFLPEVVRIRIPEVIFKASEDGYNIQRMYKKCEEYTDSYEHTVILIESTEGAIFGAYIDMMPEANDGKFVGSGDSFVFTLAPKLNKYNAKDIPGKMRIALFDQKYFLLGFDGKGPAIRVDDVFKQGRSYQSATFENDPLTCSSDAGTMNDYTIAKLEVIKL